MELILRVPKDRPPVVGVIFKRVKHACEMNGDIVDKHSDKLFSLHFSKNNNYTVNFRLGSEQLQAHREYREVKYDPVKFENFLYITRERKEFVFLHLLYDFDRFFVVHSAQSMKKFELKVNRLFFMEAVK